MRQKGFKEIIILASVLVAGLVIFLLKIGEERKNTTAWVIYKTKIDYVYNDIRNVSFRYPKELYVKDFGTANGTIWLQREPPEYKFASSVDIQIGRGQLQGEFSPTEPGVIRSNVEGGKYKIRKAEKPNTGDPSIGYGVIYYLGNMESYSGRDMAIYLRFSPIYGLIPAEDERVMKNITEEIVKSFTFID